MDIRVSFAPGAPEAVAFAARELRRYMTRMLAGHDGVVEITLAPRAPCDADARESFAVDMTGAGGSISGSGPRAVLLGAYDYLRALGCRFLGPGAELEYVPPIAPEALTARYEKRAAFAHRGVCIEGADSRENVLDFIDWLPKAGYNSFFLQFKTPWIFYERWYSHLENPLREPEKLTGADIRAWTEEAETEMKRRGLLLHKAGHGWTGEALGYESVSWNADPTPLAEEKRPLAAEVDGRRELWKGVPANTNLCFSSGVAADAFAALVTDYACAHPGVDYLHVWLADDYNNVCECPGCRGTTLSDQYVELLNEIDRRLTAAGLGTRVVFLLYQELLWPPVEARLENPGRFVLMFAPISRTFERSYPALPELSPPLPEYVRNRVELPTELGVNLAFLRAWQGLFHGDSFIYDYPLGRAHYGDFGYVKLARVISGDVKRLRALGLDGYMSCQELRAGAPNFLPNYVLGRTLMDDGADVNALLGEYFSAAYGEDWPLAADYLSALSALSDTDYVNGKGPRENASLAARMGDIRELCEGFAPTLEEHRGDTLFWDVLDFHREYVLRLSRALEQLARGNEAGASEAWRDFRQFICEHEPELQPWLDVYRVLEVTKKYTGF